MLDIRVKDNIWETSQFYEDSIVDIVNYAYDHNDKYPFLSSIDYYGVTLFSYQQLNNNLIPELQIIKKNYNGTIDIDKLILYLSKISQHQFLEVIGD